MARADEWEKITGAFDDVEHLVHRLLGDVREVDQHPQPVHLAHDLDAERRQAAVLGRRRGRVGPVRCSYQWVSVM